MNLRRHEFFLLAASAAALRTMLGNGRRAAVGSPADYGKLISYETEKWGKVIREAAIKAE
jgi:hypothetical protein